MRLRFLAAAITLLTGLAVGCGTPPDPFAYYYGTGIGPWVTRPGWDYGYNFDLAENTSHSTLTLQAVRLSGPGVGTVVRIVKARIAPFSPRKNAEKMQVDQGNYAEDPPVELGPDGCQRQALYQVRGFQLRPGTTVRLWVIIKAVKPGHWQIPHLVLTYTENGGTYKHIVPFRYWGTIRTNAHVSARIVPDDFQAQCVKPEGARYLHYYRS